MLVKFLKIYIKFLRWITKIFGRSQPLRYFFITLTFVLSIIKMYWVTLKKYAIIRYIQTLIIVLSYVNLFYNIILVLIYTNFNILDWFSTIPAFIYLFEYLPENIQDFLFNLKNKIIYLWNLFMNYYRKLLKAVLGTIEKIYPENSPGEDIPNKNPDNLDPSPNKGDETYRKWLGDYQYHLIAGAIFLNFWVYIYLYWDDISRLFSRGRDGDDTPSSESGPSFATSNPSSNRNIESYPEGYLRQFSRAMKNKAVSLFKNNKISDYPTGIYLDGEGKKMWKGLPLPRVESLNNGIEYYISADNDNYIRIVNNKFGESNMVDIIDPNSNISIGRDFINHIEKLTIIKDAKSHAFFTAPEDSYIRNQLFSNINLTKPSLDSISADTTDLPLNLEDKTSYHSDFNIASISDYKGKYPEFKLPNINLEEDAFSNIPLEDLDKTPKPRYASFEDFVD
jgi:hypothetical protein